VSVRWEWRDTGSGPGAMQRVSGDLEFSRTREAYRAYADHGAECRVCTHDASQCTEAEQLWQAYKGCTR
jgi:hypothetical protein